MADFFVTLVGLLLVGIGPPGLTLVLLRRDRVPPQALLRRQRIRQRVKWLFAILVLVFVFVVEARSFASIGIHLPDRIDIGFNTLASSQFAIQALVHALGVVLEVLTILRFAIAALLLMLGIGFLYYAIPVLLWELLLKKTVGTPPPAARDVFVAVQPWPRKVMVAVTAGITGELLYRGYLLERVVDLTGSSVVAGTLSVGVAVVAARPGRTTHQMIESVGPNVGFVLTYFAFRNLPFSIVFHTVIVGVGLLFTSPEDELEQMDDADIDEPIASMIDDG